MRLLTCVFLLGFLSGSFGQSAAVFPFDPKEEIRMFQNGHVTKRSYNPQFGYAVSGDIILYGNQENIMHVYVDGKDIDLRVTDPTVFKATNNWVIYTMGAGIRVIDQEGPRTIAQWGDILAYEDSVIAFNQITTGDLHIYYKGKDYEIHDANEILQVRVDAGENVVAFNNNNDELNVFWQGRIYNSGLPNATKVLGCGRHMVVFFDESMAELKMFYAGEFVTLEYFEPETLYIGDEMLAYPRLEGDFVGWYQGDREELLSFEPENVSMEDDMMAFEANGEFHVFFQGEQTVLERGFIPTTWVLDQQTLAYANQYGQIMVFDKDGKRNAHMGPAKIKAIHGNVLVIEEGPGFGSFWWQGKLYNAPR